MDKKTKAALVLRRVINAKRDKVFAAWTKPEIMNKWFYCGVGKAAVTSNFQVGGSYENKMIMSHGCGDTAEPNTHIHSGEYLEIIPPEKLVFTWSSAIVTNSRVTVELRDLGNSTELTLTHELLETEELRQLHNQGWEGCFANLETYFQ